ncbi:MAG: hypothetical protein ABIQ64_00675 [Candidatus Saccharimonadales bacterium]
MIMDTAEVQSYDYTPEVSDKIEDAEPLLHALVDTLLTTEKTRWNVLIGDDSSGRLPTRFVHEVLKQDGRDHKTFFVASSKMYRSLHGLAPYEAYFEYITSEIGEPLRPLVVTESVDTGRTIDFLREALEPFCIQKPEFAAVAASTVGASKVDYVGGIGERARNDVWHAFESPPELSLARAAMLNIWRQLPGSMKTTIKSKIDISINPPTINSTVGIETDLDSPIPIVRLTKNRDSVRSASAYRQVDDMAKRYRGL